MSIKELDIVTLSDDKDYIVAKKVEMNGIKYYCFVDTDNDESFRFLYEDQNELVDIDNANVFEKVLSLMAESIKTSELLVALKNRLVAKGILEAN